MENNEEKSLNHPDPSLIEIIQQLEAKILNLQKMNWQKELQWLRKQVQDLQAQVTFLQKQNNDLISKLVSNYQLFQLILSVQQTMNQPNDKSQKIRVGGDFNIINATQSVVNLRDIIGTVNQTIEQIPSTAAQDQDELKQLLQELTTAI